jgi:SAM-dependent methyltransferase
VRTRAGARGPRRERVAARHRAGRATAPDAPDAPARDTLRRMTDHPVQGLSFGAAADLYDRHRPRYPPAALHWALGADPCTVVDLGAGTGILTRILIDLGHRVTAVEPDDAMRAQLSENLPGTDARRGSAETIPLATASVDAAVAGQAYHWFDRDRAHPEIARVLRAGGVFAPIWNIRDESEPWVAELSRLGDDLGGRGGEHAHAGWTDDLDLGPLFGDAERAVFPHAISMDAASLLAMMQTRSYYLTASPAAQDDFSTAVRRLLDGRPDTFEMPFLTVVYRARRVGARG